MRKSKTFQEGDECTPAMMFASDVIWEYIESEGEPEEETYYLGRKIKITVEVYEKE